MFLHAGANNEFNRSRRAVWLMIYNLQSPGERALLIWARGTVVENTASRWNASRCLVLLRSRRGVPGPSCARAPNDAGSALWPAGSGVHLRMAVGARLRTRYGIRQASEAAQAHTAGLQAARAQCLRKQSGRERQGRRKDNAPLRALQRVGVQLQPWHWLQRRGAH